MPGHRETPPHPRDSLLVHRGGRVPSHGNPRVEGSATPDWLRRSSRRRRGAVVASRVGKDGAHIVQEQVTVDAIHIPDPRYVACGATNRREGRPAALKLHSRLARLVPHRRTQNTDVIDECVALIPRQIHASWLRIEIGRKARLVMAGNF